MSRAKAILVFVMPALVVLVSLDCIGDPLASAGCAAVGCVLTAGCSGKPNQPLADTSFDQAVQHSSRRSNFQTRLDGFSSPAALTVWQSDLSGPTAHDIGLPHAGLDLAQCWQFFWRTASEPRAPSLVS